jgi:hypothetical protein
MGLVVAQPIQAANNVQANQQKKYDGKQQGTVQADPQASYRHELHIAAADHAPVIKPQQYRKHDCGKHEIRQNLRWRARDDAQARQFSKSLRF